MKNKNAILMAMVCGLALCAGVTGCATTGSTESRPTDAQASAPANLDELKFWAGTAASIGTAYALRHNPETRPYFETAVGALSQLIEAQNFSPVSFAQALSGLKIKELKSEEAQLLITTATIIFQRYGREVVVDRASYVAVTMVTVRDAIRDALAATPAAAR